MAEAEEIRKSLVEKHGAVQDVHAYLDDPDISEHDKELQGSLDHEMEHPDDVLERVRGRYAKLELSSPLYAGVLGSFNEERLLLEQAMSDEAIAEREANYARYLALREEALAKGFVRHGNCRNLRQDRDGAGPDAFLLRDA